MPTPDSDTSPGEPNNGVPHTAYPVGLAAIQPLLWLGLIAVGWLTWLLAILLDDIGGFFRETALGLGAATLAFALNTSAMLGLFNAAIVLRGGRHPSTGILFAVAWAGIAPFTYVWLLMSDGAWGWMAIVPWTAFCTLLLLLLLNHRTRCLTWSKLTWPRQNPRRAWRSTARWAWIGGTLAGVMILGMVTAEPGGAGRPVGPLFLADTALGNLILGVTMLLLLGLLLPEPGGWNLPWTMAWSTAALAIWGLTLAGFLGMSDDTENAWAWSTLLVAVVVPLGWFAWDSLGRPLTPDLQRGSRGSLVWRRP